MGSPIRGFGWGDMRPGRVVMVVFASAALLGPVIAPHAPDAIDLNAQFALPSAQHWLGTADNGVDVLSVLLYGARLAGLIALCTVAISLVLGSALGAFAGYRGGR